MVKKKKKHVHVRPSFLWLAALVGLSGNVAIDTALKAQVALPYPYQLNFTVMDDGDSGFSTNGGTPVAHAKSYKRDFTHLLSADTDTSATWTFTNLNADTYNIYATWTPFGTNNATALYNVSTESDGLIVSQPALTADQRNVPNDAAYDSMGWEKIGTITMNAGTLRITLIGGNTLTIADGLALQPVSQTVESSASSAASSGGAVIEYYCNGVWQSTPCDGSTGGGVEGPWDGPMDGPASSLPSGGIGGTGGFPVYCGDSLLQTGEACDDGNKKAGDGCSASCTSERCGDGVVTPSLGEECDATASNCLNCKWLYCGDTILTAALGEDCDDGNVRRGDGCSENCRREVATSSTASFSPPASSSRSSSSSATPILPSSASTLSSSRSSVTVLPSSSARSSSSAQQPTSQPSNGSAMLTIRELDIGANEIVLPGQKGILLKRFEVETRSDTNVQLVLMIFGGDMLWNSQNSSGALKMQNYSLYMDTNGDGTAETLFNAKQKADGPAAVSFTNNRTFVGGTKTLFEMRADMLSPVSNIQLGYSFMNIAQPVTALNTANGLALSGMSKNGVCPVSSCSMQLITLPPKKINVAQQGALYITKSATPVPSHQILGGALSDILFRAQLRAERETISVSKMAFFIPGNGFSGIDHLQVFASGYTGVVGYAQKTKCPSVSNSAFCVTFNPALSVLPGTPMELSVKAQLKSDEQGAVSGQEIGISLDPGFPGVVEARGVTSQNLLTISNGDSVDQGEFFIGTPTPGIHQAVTSTIHTILLQRFSKVENASWEVDGTAIPSGVAPIGHFRFFAPYNGNTKNGLNKATITDLIFTVNLANIQMNPNSFKLYNRADTTTKTPCSVLDYTEGASTFHVACWNMADGAVNTILPPSSSSVLVLEGEVTDTDTAFFGRSTLQVSLDSFTDATLKGVSSESSHIRWLDGDSGTSQEFFWIEQQESVIRSTAYSN